MFGFCWYIFVRDKSRIRNEGGHPARSISEKSWDRCFCNVGSEAVPISYIISTDCFVKWHIWGSLWYCISIDKDQGMVHNEDNTALCGTMIGAQGEVVINIKWQKWKSFLSSEMYLKICILHYSGSKIYSDFTGAKFRIFLGIICFNNYR